MKKLWLVIGLVSLPLLTAGCGGGGGGLSSLFGGGDSGGGDVFSALVSGGSSSGATETLTSSAATVHNPEPASVALFGGGLAGLVCLRRRNARRSKSAKR